MRSLTVTFTHRQIEDKVSKAVADARKDWKSKEKKHRDQSETKVRELSKLVVEVESKVEKDNWQLKQVRILLCCDCVRWFWQVVVASRCAVGGSLLHMIVLGHMFIIDLVDSRMVRLK